MKTRVILSTKLLLEPGTFRAKEITQEQAIAWLSLVQVENYCGHETDRILGLEPDRSRKNCPGYDEALAVNAKSRLDFGREYTRAEIEAIGVEFTLIKRMPGLSDILALAAKLPAGLNDPKAADKLIKEHDELLESIAQDDRTGALTEAADAAYYAAKHLDYVAALLDLSIDDVLSLAIAKYSLRAAPGNPKDDNAERAAVVAALQ